MSRAATATDLLRILREHSRTLERQLHVSDVQFSMPTDGRGLRIKVSVRPGESAALPTQTEIDLNGDMVRVPLEVAEDYERYQLQ